MRGRCWVKARPHVRSGRHDRKAWEDHLIYVAAFEKLPYRSAVRRTVVLGDFNQRIPRKYTPENVSEALLQVFKPFRIATKCMVPGAPALSIDHIAHTADLEAGDMHIWLTCPSCLGHLVTQESTLRTTQDVLLAVGPGHVALTHYV